MSEACLGYPEHTWLAVGNLSEAEDELVSEYPAMAEIVRAKRLEYIVIGNSISAVWFNRHNHR